MMIGIVQRNELDTEYEKVVFTSDHISATHKDLEGILITAWESGSNYWIEKTNINKLVDNSYYDKHKWCTSEVAYHTLLLGGRIEIIDREGDVYVLTLSKLMQGLKRWLAIQGKWESKKNHINEKGRINVYLFDENDADCVLQYALFNTICYG